jgi:hypothetical protein
MLLDMGHSVRNREREGKLKLDVLTIEELIK